MALSPFYLFRFIILSLFFSTTLLFQARYCSAETVTAFLSQVKTQGVIIEINLVHPAPTNLIVQLNLPTRTEVLKINPSPAKINRQKGFIKWLLKDVLPGRLLVEITTRQSLSLAEVSALIRFRKPGKDDLVEIEAYKK